MFLKIIFRNDKITVDQIDLGEWNTNDKEPSKFKLNLTRGEKLPKADISHINIDSNKIIISRGASGEHPIFYTTIGDVVLISNSAARIANLVEAKISIIACYEFIYFEYPGPGRTLFEGVFQVLNGQNIEICKNKERELEVKIQDSFTLPTIEYENVISNDELARKLREEITRAHAARVSNSNTVLLSGGIDSQVMAIALSRDLGLQNILTATFAVKGADQNESSDAAHVAKQLGLEWLLVEVDPNIDIDFDELTQLNSPYIGSIAMQQLLPRISSSRLSSETLFAGQDTRLHTPALGVHDKWIWNTLFRSTILPSMSAKISEFGLSKFAKTDENRFIYRLLKLFAESPNFASFLANRYFHVRRFFFNENSREFSRAFSNIYEELRQADPREPRATYNRIVSSNWRRQYLFDIGHMVGSANKSSLSCALPFYDKSLSDFSAIIPFSVATKLTVGRAGHSDRKIKVNKYVLREAYKNDLDHSMIYRDKAVCATNYLFFNGCLREIIGQFIEDAEIPNSHAGRILHMVEIQNICKEKDGNWKAKDNWIANVVFNAIIVWRTLKKYGSTIS